MNTKKRIVRGIINLLFFPLLLGLMFIDYGIDEELSFYECKKKWFG